MRTRHVIEVHDSDITEFEVEVKPGDSGITFRVTPSGLETHEVLMDDVEATDLLAALATALARVADR
jgi:hypothetical protein